MEIGTYIARIAEVRGLLKELGGDCEIPQIEAMLRNADMELHWALWNLGAPVALRPELEGKPRPRSADGSWAAMP